MPLKGNIFRYSLLILGVLLSTGVVGQVTRIKKFTEEKTKFLEEINTMLVESAQGERKKEGTAIVGEFTTHWNGTAFTQEERQSVYKLCNDMLKKRMRPFPDFINYIDALNNFIRTSQPKASFVVWQESLEIVVNGKTRKKFSDYLEFCYNLFRENAVTRTPSTLWKTDNSHYIFEIENDQPKIVFPSLTLSCFAKRENAVIYKTSGVYYPLEYKWVGKNGVVNWVRSGLDENEVYATLKTYEINTKLSKYEADSVVFHNTRYFDKPLSGRLSDKVLANVTTKNATYPRFDSYNKRLKITNIIKGVDYDGGFSQHGAKFIGSGNDEEDAYLIFRRNDTVFITASAKSFSIREDKITSQRAAIKIFLHKDSITHPGLNIRLDIPNREVRLFRTDEGVNKSPYFNTFHNIDMYAEVITWKLDDPIIHLTTITGSSDKTARFESNDFFREYKFDKLQGLSEIHPLVQIRDCFDRIGSDVIYASDVSKCMHVSASQVRPFLMKISNMGLLEYDYESDKITIKDRLRMYIAAKSKKQDYDVLEIRSEIDGESNASINLLDDIYDLTIRGVRKIILSDSHSVAIIPDEQTVIMKKNRDFDFNGTIQAGKFQFYGTNHSFLYEDFKIKMPNVDYAGIVVETDEKDENGDSKYRWVKSQIEYLNGELEIDNPQNKSGVEDLPEYPIFTSLKDSYVFYEKPEVHDNVYKRDNFNFHLEPFRFDSLDNFENERIHFEGTFESADIFPIFEERLTLQPDYSLGFVRQTPKEGFPIYKGEGTYYKQISMSNEGLRGDGKLKYLTSTTESEDYLFLPEFMESTAAKFVLEEQMGEVEYPPMNGRNVAQTWTPYEDSMHVATIEEPFKFYDGNSTLVGHIDLTEKGLGGGGTFAFEEAELESNLFDFKFSEFFADTADFRLKSEVTDENAIKFSTDNVNAHIDFKERKGEFLSNGGGEYVTFHENQYIAFMDRFTWYMDDEVIELSAGKSTKETGVGELAFEGARFISTHPDQDSLDFFSVAAKYDLRHNIIDARKVELIKVADALIYPDSQRVVIKKKAKMETLNNAVIEANSVTKYHRIDSVSVNIFAKRDYAATGVYFYVDENGEKQVIRFDNVSVDSSAQTYATGAINDTDNFMLSPNYEYKGVVRLAASKKDLLFTGNVRILHACENMSKNWMKFSAEIDPEEIYIPIATVPLDIDDNRLAAAMMISRDSAGVYSTFLSPPHDDLDRKVLPVEGFLFFDKESKEYKISNVSKLNEFSLPGNYLSLNTEDCKIYGEGNIDFGADLGRVSVRTVGNATHNTLNDEVEMDAMILVDFALVDKSLERMAKLITEYGSLEPVDFERDVYEKGLRELLSAEEADKLISQVALGSFKKFPSELEKTMFITDLKLKWNRETNSYQSTGRIGIGNIQKKQVNLMVDGRVEVIKKRSGDVITIYLEMDKDNWFFFSYSRGIMQAYSSDEEFNTAIEEIKADKRKLKNEKGKSPYSFMLSNKRKRSEFLRRFTGS